MLRRLFVVAAVVAAGCSHAPAGGPAARNALAPTGTLRVAVNVGSPSSYVVTKDGREAGLSFEMAQLLGKRLGVPVQVIKYERIAVALADMKAGKVDMTFTNATEERARDVDFSPTILHVELGYLVGPHSQIGNAEGVDKPGVRLGVSEGSSSHRMLPQHVKAATLVPAPSLAKAVEMLRSGSVDVYTTNMAILYEMSDQVPGSRVLPRGWALENLAIAYPKGRESGKAEMAAFANELRGSAALKAMISRANLRGVAGN
ncbi:MAG TPA: transporter substrate-binding domain-containing protein [Ramlibacter sp.]|nr:transporter substrate-binding domain-containing protein [Ramlibacter sp.]